MHRQSSSTTSYVSSSPHPVACGALIFGPFPTGEYLPVVIDAYSRFPEVDIVRWTSGSAIVPRLDQIFTTHSIPMILLSSKCPLFLSYEVKRYMREKGIKHKKTTLLWSQVNSEAEGFRKILTKARHLVHTEGKLWTNHLYNFLLKYRTVHHVTTRNPPATLLFNRSVCNKLPQITPTVSDKDHQVRERDQKAKDKMTRNADTKRRASPSELKVGDKVLVQQHRQNKFSTCFDPRPFKVTEKGTMVTACWDDNYM